MFVQCTLDPGIGIKLSVWSYEDVQGRTVCSWSLLLRMPFIDYNKHDRHSDPIYPFDYIVYTLCILT